MSSSASSSFSGSSHSGSSQTDYTSSSSFESIASDMSIVSTPYKRGVAGVEKQTINNIKNRIMEDVQGKYTSNVSLSDFVTHVWGIEYELATRILNAACTLPTDALNKYQSATVEKKMYNPFATIADSIFRVARKVARQFYSDKKRSVPIAHGDSDDPPIAFWNALGDQALRSPLTSRKPDLLAVKNEHAGTTPRWVLVREPVEMKNGKKREDNALPTIAPFAKSKKKSTKSRGHTSCPSSFPGPSRLSVAGDDASYDLIPSPSGSQKRKLKQSNGGSDKKRRRTTPVTSEQMQKQHRQLAYYALECLAASTRHYVSGLWIDRFKISLWYFDRSCILRTEVFDFSEDPRKLALILYAINVCDDKHAGFDPYLKACSPLPDCSTADRNEHWQEVVGCEFDFPASTKYPGRGKYRIEETLFANRGLIGRGTMVYRVAPLFEEEGTASVGDEALKVAWPLLTRTLEGSTLERLHDRLPAQWRDHIPEVTFSATVTPEQLQLPRVELLKLVPNSSFEDRQLHVLGMKLYRKLWEIGSAEEFMNVFIHCVECHYHAYVDGKVLHRDLSENNLMFKVTDGTKKGILNDWDMASFVGDDNEIQLSTAAHRTGTVPFMARDLLVDTSPPPHLFRHDLESFFYILIRAAVLYDFPMRTRLPAKTVPLMEEWDEETFRKVQNSKIAFITTYKAQQELLSFVRPGCEPLMPSMKRLCTLFHTAHLEMEMNHEVDSWDETTLGGHVTFSTFMAALRPNDTSVASAAE